MLPTAPGKLLNGLNLSSSSPLQLPPHLQLQQHKVKQKIDEKRTLPRALCTSLQKEQPELTEENVSVICEPCNGRGWVLCSFCQGKKTNVKSKTSRIYRRCPTCKAVGYILCSKCKVYKCVTFPDCNDGQL